jgi:NTP pyrophosphatase (non-canonical NTP hydrolase)
MISDKYDSALKETSKIWGGEFNLDMAIEECAELIQAIQHLRRNRCNVSKVAEELADVSIMIRQLIIDLNCEASYLTHVARKIIRLKLRIAARNANIRGEEV